MFDPARRLEGIDGQPGRLGDDEVLLIRVGGGVVHRCRRAVHEPQHADAGGRADLLQGGGVLAAELLPGVAGHRREELRQLAGLAAVAERQALLRDQHIAQGLIVLAAQHQADEPPVVHRVAVDRAGKAELDSRDAAAQRRDGDVRRIGRQCLRRRQQPGGIRHRPRGLLGPDRCAVSVERPRADGGRCRTLIERYAQRGRCPILRHLRALGPAAVASEAAHESVKIAMVILFMDSPNPRRGWSPRCR